MNLLGIKEEILYSITALLAGFSSHGIAVDASGSSPL